MGKSYGLILKGSEQVEIRKYRPEIDGLRAVAVIAVIIFHFRFDWLPGGYLGVDVFFVISGFLITSIILKELKQGIFTLSNFWARRVRRIFPALLAMIFVTSIVTLLIGFKNVHPEIGKQSIFAIFSVANIFFWKNTGDYWGTASESLPLLHTWSLSVEEQFYAFFPILMLLTYKLFTSQIKWLLYIITFISFLLFIWGADVYPSATFYLLPTRVWELGLGCILAYWTNENKFRLDSNVWGGFGLILILSSYFFVPSIGLGSLFPVLGAWLVIASCQSGLSYRLLTMPPMLFIGKISYSLYLWHWPVIVIAREYIDIAPPFPVLMLIILLLSLTSYLLIEKPTRRAKNTVPITLISCLLVILFGGLIVKSGGIYDTSRFNILSYYGPYFDLNPKNFEPKSQSGPRASMYIPSRESSLNAYIHGGIIIGSNTDKPDVVLLGDSHGIMWSNTIRDITNEIGITTSFYSMDSVQPFFSENPKRNQHHRFISSNVKFAYDQARLDFIKRWKPKIVIISTRWSHVKDLDLAKENIKFLSNNADNVILLGDPPELLFGNRYAIQQLCYLDYKAELGESYYLPFDAESLLNGVSIGRKLAESHSNVSFFSMHNLYTQGEKSIIANGPNVIYFDDDHLSEYGAQMGKELLHTMIISNL